MSNKDKDPFDPKKKVVPSIIGLSSLPDYNNDLPQIFADLLGGKLVAVISFRADSEAPEEDLFPSKTGPTNENTLLPPYKDLLSKIPKESPPLSEKTLFVAPKQPPYTITGTIRLGPQSLDYKVEITLAQNYKK